MKTMEERIRIFSISLALCFVLLAHGVGDTGVINTDRIQVTDVTPVSFSVVWATSEPATCGLNLFLDADGTTPYVEAVIRSESSEHHPAEFIGVMKVRVTNLKPSTQYYFQIITTSKSNGTIWSYPDIAPYLEVTTEQESVIVRNDVLAQEIIIGGWKSTQGTLLIGEIDQASYPVTGWTGEDFPDNWGAIDTNNFYDQETHVNLELLGGEVINLILLGGGSCFVDTQDIVPAENGGIQALAVKAILPDSTCQNLRPKFMLWIPLLLLDD